jgi:hypothetical protein
VRISELLDHLALPVPPGDKTTDGASAPPQPDHRAG